MTELRYIFKAFCLKVSYLKLFSFLYLVAFFLYRLSVLPEILRMGILDYDHLVIAGFVCRIIDQTEKDAIHFSLYNYYLGVIILPNYVKANEI